MTPEQVLAIPPRVLTQAQREFYFSEGYILLEAIIGDEWMQQAARRHRGDGRAQPQGHALRPRLRSRARPPADAPRLRRVSNPTEHHPVFWEYVNRSVLPRCGRRPGRPGRQVPPLEAELQVEPGRRGGEVALRHLVLAAHQLLAAHRRHLHLRLRHGARARSACIPQSHRIEPMLTPVRRRRQMGRLPVAARRRQRSTSRRRCTSPARPAR